ncbi:hypothetical protein PO002_40080 [Cupriavidus necator]
MAAGTYRAISGNTWTSNWALSRPISGKQDRNGLLQDLILLQRDRSLRQLVVQGGQGSRNHADRRVDASLRAQRHGTARRSRSKKPELSATAHL